MVSKRCIQPVVANPSTLKLGKNYSSRQQEFIVSCSTYTRRTIVYNACDEITYSKSRSDKAASMLVPLNMKRKGLYFTIETPIELWESLTCW
jgi:hypothetical protein